MVVLQGIPALVGTTVTALYPLWNPLLQAPSPVAGLPVAPSQFYPIWCSRPTSSRVCSATWFRSIPVPIIPISPSCWCLRLPDLIHRFIFLVLVPAACLVVSTGTLPGSWGNASAFPSLTELIVSQNELEGKLVLTARRRAPIALLFGIRDCLNDDRSACSRARSLAGPLPPAWGLLGFQHLKTLTLDSNSALTGAVPSSWGGPGAFPIMVADTFSKMWLFDTAVCGPVPVSLQQVVGFPSPPSLALSRNSRHRQQQAQALAIQQVVAAACRCAAV